MSKALNIASFSYHLEIISDTNDSCFCFTHSLSAYQAFFICVDTSDSNSDDGLAFTISCARLLDMISLPILSKNHFVGGVYSGCVDCITSGVAFAVGSDISNRFSGFGLFFSM